MEKTTKKSSQKATTASTKAKVAVLAHGTGRRKSSVARIWVRRGKGQLTVNSKPYDKYFDTLITRLEASKPLKLIPESANYDISVNVVGGGLNSQADAIKLGISRAFVVLYESLRPLLRENNLLTVDSRVKERKKYGQRGARRKFQFVKR